MFQMIYDFLGISTADVIGVICVDVASVFVFVLLFDFVVSAFRRLLGFF